MSERAYLVHVLPKCDKDRTLLRGVYKTVGVIRTYVCMRRPGSSKFSKLVGIKKFRCKYSSATT
jgi:hypothetical protein